MRQIERVVAAALAGVVVSSAVAQDAVQWRVEDGGNGHWYEFRLMEAGCKAEAVSATTALGAHLATATSEEENDFMDDLIPNQGFNGLLPGAYIGGYQVPGSGTDSEGWYWVTGETWDYTAWSASGSQPSGGSSEDCVFMYSLQYTSVGSWHDSILAACDTGLVERPYIVEWSADCNGDGIVDYGQILDGTFADNNANGVPDCCDTGTPCSAITTQWDIALGGNGNWYAAIPLETDSDCWSTSNMMAIQRGGHLATILSVEENQFLLDFINTAYSGANCSIGGILDETGNWQWITGEPWEFTNWQAGEPGCCLPDEDWLDFNVGSGEWRDRQECVDQFPNVLEPGFALVEWSADCNGDGLVDYGQILDGTFEDADGNGVPDCCDADEQCDPCIGDLNGDGVVGPPDLGILLAVWDSDGSIVTGSDINGDGTVNASDLGPLRGAWGACP